MQPINSPQGGSFRVLSRNEMKHILAGTDSGKQYKCCYTDANGNPTSCSACVTVQNPYCERGSVFSC